MNHVDLFLDKWVDIKMKFDPELDVILSLLRHRLHESEYVDIGDDPLDWERLIRLANTHRVTPLIYRALKHRKNVAPEVNNRMRQMVLNQSVCNIRAATQLVELLGLFQKQNIPVIPFKGHVLGADLYGDVALRPSVDFDLYVPNSQAIAACELLKNMGYNSPLLDQHGLSVLSRFFTIEFSQGQQNLHIDLHLDLTDGFVQDMFNEDELVKGIRPLEFEQQTINVFDMDTTLALIAIHGAKGSWAFLSALLDLAFFFRRYSECSYGDVITMLRRRGLLRMLSVGACLVERLFKMELFREISKNIDDRSVELARVITHRLYENPFQPARTGWDKVLLNVQMREKWREKMRYIRFMSRSKKVDMYSAENGSSRVRHIKRILGFNM